MGPEENPLPPPSRMPSQSKTEIPWAWGHAWVVTGLAAEARLSQIAWGLFLTAGVQRPPHPPCRKCAYSQSVARPRPASQKAAEEQRRRDTRCPRLSWGGARGTCRGVPSCRASHTRGSPLLPSFPQTLPPWPSSCGHQPLSPRPRWGHGREPSGLLPSPSNPTPSALSASPQSPPSSLPPGSLSVFTICQLGSLNTLYTESQPAKRGDPAAPPLPLFSSGLGDYGLGEEVSLPFS